MKFLEYYNDLVALNVGTVLKDEPLYKHTTYHVGGPAKLFVMVEEIDGLAQTIKYCRRHRIPLFVIGRGSNLLFSDRSFDGLIISLEKMNKYEVNGCTVKAQAGVSMIKLAYDCAKYGLSGFEFMGGIPGNIGGAIFMNAGAYNSTISEVVESVTILDESLTPKTFTREQMQFSYRHSILQEHKKWLVLDATFTLQPKPEEEIKELLDKRKERRMATQPWNKPSAGSVFRNPETGPAWKYVDDAGLRGYEIAGAQVSPKHSNFIVNNGYASAKDIYDLIHLVKDTVYEKFGVELKPEVRFINWEND